MPTELFRSKSIRVMFEAWPEATGTLRGQSQTNKILGYDWDFLAQSLGSLKGHCPLVTTDNALQVN